MIPRKRRLPYRPIVRYDNFARDQAALWRWNHDENYQIVSNQYNATGNYSIIFPDARLADPATVEYDP